MKSGKKNQKLLMKMMIFREERKIMYKYILVGFMGMNFTLMALEVKVFEEHIFFKKDENQTKNQPKKKKIFQINLDIEKESDDFKGGESDPIKGVLSLGDYDEITFKGKKSFIATPIKLYLDKKPVKSIDKSNKKLKIETSKLSVGNIIRIKNRFSIVLLEKIIIK